MNFHLNMLGSDWQYGSIGSENGLAPYRRQAIIWSNVGSGYRRMLGLDFFLSGVPDLWDRNKILSGGDLSHYQVPHCMRVFFYFVWFVFIHHNFQFHFELCTYCNILDIYLS